MLRFILQIAINAVAIWAAAQLVPGIVFETSHWWAFTVVGAVFGIVNFLIRPILMLIGLPFIILTLGLFMLVINAALLGLTAWLLEVLSVTGFGAAVLGGLIVSIVAWGLEALLGVEEPG
jgi:putative membrane protein